jgi:hypothetical protein
MSNDADADASDSGVVNGEVTHTKFEVLPNKTK